DDLGRSMGDPAEASTAAALGAIAGNSCAPLSGVSQGQSFEGEAKARDGGRRELLVPARPGVVQREVPGTY
ncbi:MAG: S41 family peptidase, partial [Sandaracinobacteroides sp.]